MSPATNPCPNSPLPYDITETMEALYTLGYWLVPLGNGDEGKAPSANQPSKRLPLQVVRERMAKTGHLMYGIRLPNLVVVDLDNMLEENIAYAEQRFGISPFIVKSPRGEHWYFRLGNRSPNEKVIRLPEHGIKIDLKTGANSYVAGPDCVRPDGGQYRMIGEPLPPVKELPVFVDHIQQGPKLVPLGVTPAQGSSMPKPQVAEPKRPASKPEQELAVTNIPHAPTVVDINGRGVPVGQRNNQLWPMAIKLAREVGSLEELETELMAYAAATFECLEGYGQAQIAKRAKWVWRLRLEGKLWGGQSSAAVVTRHELLAADKHGSDGRKALRLIHELRHTHGAIPGKRFAVSPKGMARANVINGWKEKSYTRGLKVALEIGTLRQVKKHTGNSAAQYILTNVVIDGG